MQRKRNVWRDWTRFRISTQWSQWSEPNFSSHEKSRFRLRFGSKQQNEIRARAQFLSAASCLLDDWSLRADVVPDEKFRHHQKIAAKSCVEEISARYFGARFFRVKCRRRLVLRKASLGRRQSEDAERSKVGRQTFQDGKRRSGSCGPYLIASKMILWFFGQRFFGHWIKIDLS